MARIKPIVGQLLSPMTFALSFFVLVSAAGLLAVLHLLRSAPEGYEDETDFHFTKQEDAPLRSPVLVPVKSARQPAHF